MNRFLTQLCIFSLTFVGLTGAALSDDNPGNAYEKGLLETIKNIQSLDHDKAILQTRALIKKYPRSRLSQMLYADLLLAKAGPLAHVGSGIKANQAIQDFRHEIKQRWQNDASPAYQGMLPDNILYLAEEQPYVILIDQLGSRIYVYRNDDGVPVLETDYFITIGLKGYGKQKQGDQKTPIGIYHVTKYIEGDELPDLYGEGAFPISYPNVWDIRKKRTGGGIWIHGTPKHTYNRSPWASNGCIVVSNPDFLHLDDYIKPGLHTPVIVTEKINWIDKKQWQKNRQQVFRLLSNWVNDWESLDHDAYASHYSPIDFESYGRNFKSWDGHKRWVNRKKTKVDVEVSQLNIFNYPGEKDLLLMQYQQDYKSNNFNLDTPKEVYWHKKNEHWQIVYEGARSFPVPDSLIVQN